MNTASRYLGTRTSQRWLMRYGKPGAVRRDHRKKTGSMPCNNCGTVRLASGSELASRKSESIKRSVPLSWRERKPPDYGPAYGNRSRERIRQRVEMGAPLNTRQLALLGHSFSRSDRKSTRLNSSHLGISYAV